jgi:hypothetical protein
LLSLASAAQPPRFTYPLPSPSDTSGRMLRIATSRLAAPARAAQLQLLAPLRCASTVAFTKEHEFVRLDGKIGTCGITDFAQSQLGDIVYVGLPEVGAKYKKG